MFITLFIRGKSHERFSVSDHLPLEGLFNSLFEITSEKHQMSTVLVFCEGNPPVTGGFFSQRTSNAGRASISLSHHVTADRLPLDAPSRNLQVWRARQAIWRPASTAISIQVCNILCYMLVSFNNLLQKHWWRRIIKFDKKKDPIQFIFKRWGTDPFTYDAYQHTREAANVNITYLGVF